MLKKKDLKSTTQLYILKNLKTSKLTQKLAEVKKYKSERNRELKNNWENQQELVLQKDEENWRIFSKIKEGIFNWNQKWKWGHHYQFYQNKRDFTPTN